MFLLSFFADLINGKSFSGLITEPLAVLFFGAALFALTAGLRALLNRHDKNTAKTPDNLNEAVAAGGR